MKLIKMQTLLMLSFTFEIFNEISSQVILYKGVLLAAESNYLTIASWLL